MKTILTTLRDLIFDFSKWTLFGFCVTAGGIMAIIALSRWVGFGVRIGRAVYTPEFGI